MRRNAEQHNPPHLPPVESIELSSRHLVPRIVAVVLLLAVAVGAFVYGFMALLSSGAGWQEIKVHASGELSCGDEFVLNYNIGAGETDASAENRAVTTLYSQASVHAYRLFDTVQSWDGVVNLYDLNHHPNQVMQVSSVLYDAFSLLERYDSRYLYLGPVYAVYESLFYCQDDAAAAGFDPYADEATAAYVAEAAAFARDAKAIRLELLGDNRVRLNVSEEYLAWAEYNETEDFLNFFWLKNAFVADYLADTLAGAGYTSGTLSSYDGYIRNLDGSGTSYSLNLFDLADALLQAGTMDYTGPASLVTLRAYPMDGQPYPFYYRYEDGVIRTPFADLSDGLCRTSLPQLTCWSKSSGCAEIALQMAPLYVGSDFSPAGIEDLAGGGIWSVWCRDRVIHSNGPDIAITQLYDANGVTYTLAN